MGLTFKPKATYHFCTKAGNSPYNKGGYKAGVAQHRIVDEYKYKGAKLVILRPVIDKLIFDYNFKDCGSNKRKIQDAVLENAAALSATIKLVKATEANVGGDRFYHLSKSFAHNYVLTDKVSGSKIIIQLKPFKKGTAFLRCDINPARLGAKGMKTFRLFIKELLSTDLKVITFESIATINKNIRRIDIAVDMLGVDASDLEGRYIYKDKTLKKELVENHTGRVESMYFKMPENDKNQAYWYNKKQALKDLATDPVDGNQQSPYGSSLYTRFEYRINETDKPITNLHSFLNHLKKVHFRAIDYTKIAGKDFTHVLFLRYALGRTRNKALEMVPDDRKPEYAASYDAAIVDIWKPQKIWDKGWNAELLSLGLVTADALKKKKPKPKK